MIALNQNELEAMRILWEHGELKPGEIEDRFAWPIENATLRSVLVNLVEKGHATRRLHGKAFLYAAAVPRTSLLQSAMRSLARVFGAGSHRELVTQLVETDELTVEDLKALHQVARRRSRSKGRAS